jgi:hypothetical protein
VPRRARNESQGVRQFAADIVRRSTGREPPMPDHAVISQVMAAMGRRGGLKGAAALNGKLSPAQRKASARQADQARWGNECRQNPKER